MEILSKAYTDSKNRLDNEAVGAMLMAQAKILFNNSDLTLKVQSDICEKFVKVYQDLNARAQDKTVKNSIEDLLSLIG